MCQIFPFSPKIRQALQIPKTKTQNITIDTTVKNKYVLQFTDNHQKDRLTADLQRTYSGVKAELKYYKGTIGLK